MPIMIVGIPCDIVWLRERILRVAPPTRRKRRLCRHMSSRRAEMELMPGMQKCPGACFGARCQAWVPQDVPPGMEGDALQGRRSDRAEPPRAVACETINRRPTVAHPWALSGSRDARWQHCADLGSVRGPEMSRELSLRGAVDRTKGANGTLLLDCVRKECAWHGCPNPTSLRAAGLSQVLRRVRGVPRAQVCRGTIALRSPGAGHGCGI